MQPLILLSESSLPKKAASSRSANITVFYSPCKKFLDIFSLAHSPVQQEERSIGGNLRLSTNFHRFVIDSSSIRHSDANKTLLSTLKDLCFSSIDAELEVCLQLAVDTNSALSNKASRL